MGRNAIEKLRARRAGQNVKRRWSDDDIAALDVAILANIDGLTIQVQDVLADIRELPPIVAKSDEDAIVAVAAKIRERLNTAAVYVVRRDECTEVLNFVERMKVGDPNVFAQADEHGIYPPITQIVIDEVQADMLAKLETCEAIADTWETACKCDVTTRTTESADKSTGTTSMESAMLSAIHGFQAKQARDAKEKQRAIDAAKAAKQ